MRLTQHTALALTLAIMLTACTTANNPTRFYTLVNANHAINPGNSTPENLTVTTPMVIEILPVNVPERLKRPQLVINTDNNTQLKILEHDRWLSAFNDELQDALVSGITKQLGAVVLSGSTRTAKQPTYRIKVVLQQFNATQGQEIMANFGWAITRLNADKHPNLDTNSDGNLTLSCQTTILKVVGNNTEALVKGIQDAVEDTIQAISTNIISLHNAEEVKCGSI